MTMTIGHDKPDKGELVTDQTPKLKIVQQTPETFAEHMQGLKDKGILASFMFHPFEKGMSCMVINSHETHSWVTSGGLLVALTDDQMRDLQSGLKAWAEHKELLKPSPSETIS